MVLEANELVKNQTLKTVPVYCEFYELDYGRIMPGKKDLRQGHMSILSNLKELYLQFKEKENRLPKVC